VAASVVVLLAPAAPSTTSNFASPARAATASRCPTSSPSVSPSASAVGWPGLAGAIDQPGDDVGLDFEHIGRGPRAYVVRDTEPFQQRDTRLDDACRDVLGQLPTIGPKMESGPPVPRATHLRPS
jgi:hypothetical protein